MTQPNHARTLAAVIGADLAVARWLSSVAVVRRPSGRLVRVRVHAQTPEVWAAVARVAGARPRAPYHLELEPSVGDDALPADDAGNDRLWDDARLRFEAARARYEDGRDDSTLADWGALKAEWVALQNEIQAQGYPPDFPDQVGRLLARADAMAAAHQTDASPPVLLPPPEPRPPLQPKPPSGGGGSKPPPPDRIAPDAPPPFSSSGPGLGAAVLTLAGIGGLLLLVTSHRR